MVICKYFLRGTCRFGENCKNEHGFTENSNSTLRKNQDIDTNILLKSVNNDIDKAENGHQWPFSCYGPFQGKPCFPGFEDKSFEEIRLGLYEAEKKGTTEQYKHQLTQILNDMKVKMRSLRNPTLEAINILKKIYNASETQTNIFSNNSSSNHSSLVFGNENIFTAPAANNNFVFKLPEETNIFGGGNNQNAGSMFVQPNLTFPSSNSIFGGGQRMFGNVQQQIGLPTNLCQPSQNFNSNPGNIFISQQPNQPSIFGQNNFSQTVTSNHQPNPFIQNATHLFPQNIHQPPIQQQNPGNIFAQNPANTNPQEHTKIIFGSMQNDVKPKVDVRKDDLTVFSKLQNLNEKEIQYFQAPAFTFGQIPENAPPLEMC